VGRLAIANAHEVAEEERLRADVYGLLAGVLRAPVDQALLARLGHLVGDDSDIGQALDALAAAARRITLERAEREYHELFVGLGRGEVSPFGSFYLTGFLYEKPLALLRQDMTALGIGRSEANKEPEDHVAALCEMMAGLILGAFGEPVSLERQKKFFDAHLGSWASKFFADLEKAPSAALYMPIGRLGRLFMAIETQAFQMAA
jgi:TorA maturation chaperone TorD